MKKILLSLIAMMIAVASFAQTSLVATLTHGDNIKMFYGVDAFKEAHNAAENGDIINLSGGGFNAVDITKAVTVRGTGINDANPTYIKGNLNIKIPSEVENRLSFEGCNIINWLVLDGTIKNSYFSKNVIGGFSVPNNQSCLENAVFANCILYGFALGGESNVQFVNCYVESFHNWAKSSIAEATFSNCVIKPRYNADHNTLWNASEIFSSILVNCIIFGSTDYPIFSLPSSSSVYNCVAIGNNNKVVFDEPLIKQNCYFADFDIFQDSNPMNDLTAEAKEKYLGTDNTPVGMYGGVLPYDPTPSYPQITKMNVAHKTTADGKLNVEIEVNAVK